LGAGSPGDRVIGQRPSRLVQAVGLALLVALGANLWVTAGHHSDTVDESTYLAAATRLARSGDDATNREHPPLTKWLMGQVLAQVEPEVLAGRGNGWQDTLWGHPVPRMMRNLRAARSVSIAWTLLTGLLLFLFVGRRFGWAGALIGLSLFACSPLVNAHGALATLESGAMATALIFALALWRFFEAPTSWRAVQVGLATGLGLLTKVGLLLLGPVAAAAVVGFALWRRSERLSWRRETASVIAAVLLLAPLMIWAAYGFSSARVPGDQVAFGHHDDLAQLVGGRLALQKLVPVGSEVSLPAYDFLAGLGFQVQHGQNGHHNFMDGRVGHGGWPSFYVRSIAYETPLFGLFLGAIGLLMIPGLWRRRRSAFGLLIVPLWLLIYLSLMTKAQAGLKYLLPALPFFVAFLGVALAHFARRGGWRAGTLAFALPLLAFSVHRYAPDYLMFFNVAAGGPSEGWAHLVQGKDWGQGQRQLGMWQRRNQVTRLWYAKYSGNPRAWGIRYLKPPCRPVSGFVAAHVSEIQRPEWHPPSRCLHWLKPLEPVAHFGYSINLYEVTSEQVARLKKGTDRRWHLSP
jgi:4-amino-4-deoxy-L-arabinose transferase-like glycosyltransferase